MATTLIAHSIESRVTELAELAVRGLTPMYDAERGLFCYRLRHTASGVVREGLSHRYTLITLLGLVRAESAGIKSPVNIHTILGSLLNNTAWIRNIGDLGLLLWLCALTADDHLERFFNIFDLEKVFRCYPDRGEGRTMELAWFLTGLARAAGANQQLRANLRDLATQTHQLVRRNQGPHGIFGHQSRRGSLAGAARGHIGSFADQVYPIYAMVQFSKTYRVEEASQDALRCARALCSLQGSLGQWWWHYNSVTGHIVEHYPVFSVHQDGMAPMALFALQSACSADFRQQIYKGIEWIYGVNELHQDLTGASTNLIWRSIYQPKLEVHWARVRTLLGRAPSPGNLRILYECRPYHFGWLLYAFAPFHANGSSSVAT